MATTDTKRRILEIARGMVQAQGYNALSFRDIASELGIKGPAVHHHYPTKGDLGAALAREYTDSGIEMLEQLIERSKEPRRLLDAYVAIFRAALLNGNRMCLCGIMAAEQDALPGAVRAEVDRFTDVNIAWLMRVLEITEPLGDMRERRQRALAMFAAIEGAQLVARGRRDIGLFDTAIAGFRRSGLIP
ncbi:TetR/AcrR family transcriptional regulator [Cupriavidus sp. SIMBA_020]|uniref:TetR/AcrR family transcriptional regulator n=1 Tax=Cupriavidus sp. SIMBA_020 TaxID=3085766 RepID=UPI00397E6B56